MIVQQTMHGYREGHRLLRSSVQFGTDASRTLLVMSDMSGPSMQPGFEEYITGYPLPGSSFYVLAKTWYASEMKRPGCVWTQSLLIEQSDLAHLELSSTLLRCFRRPTVDDVESSAIEALTLPVNAGSEDKSVGGAAVAGVVSAVYANDSRPVLILGDTASQFEDLALALWLQQWPKLRCVFSFCTGALSPRVCNNAVLDFQVVPRNVSPAQYRKVAASAVIIDPRALTAVGQDAGVEILTADLSAANRGRFRRWIRVCAETESSRALVGRLARIFHFWQVEPSVEPVEILKTIGTELRGIPLAPGTASRLLGELFNLYRDKDGSVREVSLLEALSVDSESDIFTDAEAEIQVRTRDLFAIQKGACLDLLRRLLACGFSAAGDIIVRTLFASLSVADALELSASKPHLLPTVVQANPSLACSPELWSRAPVDRRELLAALGRSEAITQDLMRGVVAAVIKARAEGIADDLFRAAGESAVCAVLNAVRAGAMDLDWQWKNALTRRSEAVVSWLQQGEQSASDLALAARLVSPGDGRVRSRCAAIWAAYLGRMGDRDHDPVVAAFGLALGLGESGKNDLVFGFFQPVFNALETNSLEYGAWDWIGDRAPSLTWWRDWDKCERLAAAVAKRLVGSNVPAAELFRAVRTEAALRDVVRALDAKWESRRYLESLRMACSRDPSLGTATQRRVLQEGAW